ncbi:SAM-dependent methyltransferase [Peribacillus asahii]|uniref:SAM-dependent methyltransferase n=2 Tax=Peribacillus asahii TaxID=228899 RepID=A0A3Q9RPW5_9BACI|nr:SAM-dependent methyltransferase [Peribacillus asahii]
MYESKETYRAAIQQAKDAGFLNLATDLSTEYYTTIPLLQKVLKENGFDASFTRCNQFVWIVEAQKL